MLLRSLKKKKNEEINTKTEKKEKRFNYCEKLFFPLFPLVFFFFFFKRFTFSSLSVTNFALNCLTLYLISYCTWSGSPVSTHVGRTALSECSRLKQFIYIYIIIIPSGLCSFSFSFPSPPAPKKKKKQMIESQTEKKKKTDIISCLPLSLSLSLSLSPSQKPVPKTFRINIDVFKSK